MQVHVRLYEDDLLNADSSSIFHISYIRLKVSPRNNNELIYTNVFHGEIICLADAPPPPRTCFIDGEWIDLPHHKDKG